MRYVLRGGALGSGQYSTVHKVIDVDSGKFMAVKTLHQPTRLSKHEDWRKSLYYALKREVEILSEISHISFFNLLYHAKLIFVLATHRRLYRVTRLG